MESKFMMGSKFMRITKNYDLIRMLRYILEYLNMRACLAIGLIIRPAYLSDLPDAVLNFAINK